MRTINASANENKDRANTDEYNMLDNEFHKTSSISFDHCEEESRFSNMKSQRRSLLSSGSNARYSTSLAIIPPERAQHPVGQRQELNQISISEALKLICIIYAIACCVAGIIIPTAEALDGKWNDFVFGAVLLNFQLIVGIVFLVCLFALIYTDPGKGKAHRVETDSNLSSAENNVNTLRGGTQGNGKCDSSCSSSSFSPSNSDARTIWVDVSDFGDVFTHSETLLIVRIGSLVLSLGNLIYYGFESAHYVIKSTSCDKKKAFNWSFLLRMVFVLLQTYFMFKRPEISHMKKHRSFIWFGMFHLVSTNACLWLRTVINEILLENYHAKEYHPANEAKGAPPDGPMYTAPGHEGNDTHSVCHDQLLEEITPYLFPFVLEYSLMAVGTIGSILHSLAGAANSRNQETTDTDIRAFSYAMHPQPSTATTGDGPASGATAAAETGSHARNLEDNILDKSHTGFFVGALVVAGAIASAIVLFRMQREDQDHFRAVTYLVTYTCLHGLMLVGCIAAFALMRPLAYLPKVISIDDALIAVGMCGSLMLHMAIIVSGSEAIGSRSNGGGGLEVVRLATSVFALVQTVVQSLLLVFVMRLYASRRRHAERMPGRGIVTALVIMNVTAWVYGSVGIKSVKIDIEGKFYGTVPWLLIYNINLPLELFFRFHCGICFSDVWHLAYQSPNRHTPTMPPQLPTCSPSSGRLVSGIHPTDERSVTEECVPTLSRDGPVYAISPVRSNLGPNVRESCDGRQQGHLGSSVPTSNPGTVADGNRFNEDAQSF